MARQVLRHVVGGLTAILLAGAAQAADTGAHSYLGADLGKIALSPAPIGPPAKFVRLKSEARSDGDTARLRAPAHRIRQVKVEKVRVARKRGNPMDAQAMDARIQAWPCRSGGICDWKQ